jgi:hypothetical protein
MPSREAMSEEQHLIQLVLTHDEASVLKVVYTWGALLAGIDLQARDIPEVELRIRAGLAAFHIITNPKMNEAYSSLVQKLNMLPAILDAAREPTV